MDNFEYFQYEARPYIYALIALACYHYHSGHHSKLLETGVILLSVASLLIIRARYNYRSARKRGNRYKSY